MKKIKTLILTIILGALGSACWEWALKPICMFVYEHIIISSIHLFSDSFYSKVAKSIDAPASLTYFYLVMFIFIFIMVPPRFFYDFFHQETTEERNIIVRNAVKLCYIIVILYTAFSSFMANQTARKVLREIEIIAPYVSDIKHKTLKSDFYRMNSKTDYLKLVTQIEQIMDENHLNE